MLVDFGVPELPTKGNALPRALTLDLIVASLVQYPRSIRRAAYLEDMSLSTFVESDRI